jgi:hypothetical protein
LSGETEVHWEETRPRGTLSTTNAILPDLALNSDSRWEACGKLPKLWHGPLILLGSSFVVVVVVIIIISIIIIVCQVKRGLFASSDCEWRNRPPDMEGATVHCISSYGEPTRGCLLEMVQRVASNSER